MNPLLAAYLSDQQGTLSKSTLALYVLVLQRFEALPISLDDCKAWKMRRLTEVSPNSVTAELRALKSFDRWYSQEMGTDPVLASVRYPKATISDVAPIVSEDAYYAMLVKCGPTKMGRRDAAILAILWSTGARRSEVARLCVEDVDTVTGTIVIRETKNGHSRTAYLDPDARRRVRRWLMVSGLTEGPLWVGVRGQKVTPQLVADAVERQARAAGVAVTCHMFRRALAQRWLTKGGSEALLMATAGWHSPTMVARYVRGVKSTLALGEAQRLFG